MFHSHLLSRLLLGAAWVLAWALLAGAPAPAQSASPGAVTGVTITVYLPLMSRQFDDPPGWWQEAGNAQRTGFSPNNPNLPWTLRWTWNAADSTGGSTCTGGNPATGHCYDAPREARTVMGACCVYVPAGAHGLYALDKHTGAVRWRVSGASFNTTPAYFKGYVYAGAADGRVFRVDVFNGFTQTRTLPAAVNRALLIAGEHVFALTQSGQLHKLDRDTLQTTWVYTANTSISEGTGLAYSASRDMVIFGGNDLYVHAVHASTGTQAWRVKPSPNPAGFPNQFLWYWPVVAEQNGVVFVRMRLDHNTGLWGYPSQSNIWPNTNAAARTFLVNNPNQQNLFALDLDTGTPAFVPAVGYGGTEDWYAGAPFLTTGPLPAVRVWPNGDEVAYIHFRNGAASPNDGRQDSHMGEMVLNAGTVPGLVAGDMRFVRMACNGSCSLLGGKSSYTHITDEQNPVTLAGNTLFHAHWGASESVVITDRGVTRGLAYTNPIQTTTNPSIIRRIQACGGGTPPNNLTHWTTCGMGLYLDGRYWPSPGWWTYWNTYDPPTQNNPGGQNAYSDGMRPRYTYVSNGYVVVQGNGGELMVFAHAP